MYVFRAVNPDVILPSDKTLAEAAKAGLRNAVVAHLDEKDGRAKHRAGMPRSGYYTDAADSVQSELVGSRGAAVSIQKEGIYIHWAGGVILPKPGKKYLAIPVNPAVWDRDPSEFDPNREKLHPAGGKLKDDSDEIYYQLIKSAHIKADPDVLPTDDQMCAAMFAAMEAVL